MVLGFFLWLSRRVAVGKVANVRYYCNFYGGLAIENGLAFVNWVEEFHLADVSVKM
ncbi:hypothetical protein FD38_GL000852 [Levilactobacillus zymae DSM 19395]|nr:hypothetical protein FD38_GL000852 [Levilactobacillus zymae DSM 19395]